MNWVSGQVCTIASGDVDTKRYQKVKDPVLGPSSLEERAQKALAALGWALG